MIEFPQFPRQKLAPPFVAALFQSLEQTLHTSHPIACRWSATKPIAGLTSRAGSLTWEELRCTIPRVKLVTPIYLARDSHFTLFTSGPLMRWFHN